MQPPLPPLIVYRVESYTDNRGRVVIMKSKVDPLNCLFELDDPIFIGQGVAGVQVQTRQGVQIQQVPFEVPLPGPSIHDAFEQFDKEQEPAFRAHMEKMRIDAIKHGADLSQLPQAHKN